MDLGGSGKRKGSCLARRPGGGAKGTKSKGSAVQCDRRAGTPLWQEQGRLKVA